MIRSPTLGGRFFFFVILRYAHTDMQQGFLLIDKPAGMTSHDVVDRVRRATGERTVGHAGTLDPFATGLLIVAVGRACTKRIAEFVGMDKEYIATLKLGATSDSGDLTGVITPVVSNVAPDAAKLAEALTSLIGPQLQTPPMFSAKKIAGKKLYELAREGKTIERQPVPVTIFELQLLSTTPDELVFRSRVSSGTYIRTLGEDIAKRLGTGGYLTALRRTTIGKFSVNDAISLERLDTDRNSLPFFDAAC
jgi:tRNA pseudouridine55 synthase